MDTEQLGSYAFQDNGSPIVRSNQPVVRGISDKLNAAAVFLLDLDAVLSQGSGAMADKRRVILALVIVPASSGLPSATSQTHNDSAWQQLRYVGICSNDAFKQFSLRLFSRLFGLLSRNSLLVAT